MATKPTRNDPLGQQVSNVEALAAVWSKRAKALYAVLIAPLGLRTLVLLALAVYLLGQDWLAAKSFMFGLGLVCASLAFLHWYRKTQHPYLDLRLLVTKAGQEPLSAALVVMSVFAFMGVVLLFLLLVVIR